MKEPIFSMPPCMTLRDAQELLDILNRAANTLEPVRQPRWLLPTADRLQKTINAELLKSAKAARTRCTLGCVTECLAKVNGCASECPALPWQPGQP